MLDSLGLPFVSALINRNYVFIMRALKTVFESDANYCSDEIHFT
jgi:hypothetical protein